MTIVTAAEALALRRDRLVAALHSHPALREKLSLAEITTAVDTAMREAMVPALLDAVIAAEALADAIAATIPSPPPAVVAAVAVYTPAGGSVAGDYNVSEP